MAYLIRRYDFQTDTTDADMRWDDMVVAWFHGDFTVEAKRRSEQVIRFIALRYGTKLCYYLFYLLID